MIIQMPEEVLFKLVDYAKGLGRKEERIDSFKEPKFITQNQAHISYGKGNVAKWVKEGIVKRYKDADGKVRSGVRYNVVELDAAAFKCNYMKTLSPLAKAEKMMIYGQAGMGKSTVALSAPKPLLLDFDNGVKRMNMAHLENIDTVQVTSWNDVQQVLQEDLSDYQTMVVDTIGKMMDFIITYKCGSRQPSIRDWSGINAEFSWMARTLSSLNKHIIFVAHRDTRKEGDDTVFIPALREKSYNSIVTELDLLGYLEMKSERGIQRRTITFDPTSRNDGKNTCNLPSVMEVPTILDKNGNPTAKNDFITTRIINSYLGMLAAKKEAQEKYDKVIEEIKESIEFITDANSANEFASHINEFEHVGSSLMKARSLFAAKVNSLGLVFDKETKTYSDAA